MPIIVHVNSGNPSSGVVTSAVVHSTATGTTITHRNGSDAAALERGEALAKNLARKEAALHGSTVVEMFLNGELYSTEVVGEFEDRDITDELSEDDEAIIEAKETATDLVAEVVAAAEEEAIAGHADVIPPAQEIDIDQDEVMVRDSDPGVADEPEVEVTDGSQDDDRDVVATITQDGDRIKVLIDSKIDFNLWRRIGSGSPGTRKISAGQSEVSYKGEASDAEFRVEDENGPLL